MRLTDSVSSHQIMMNQIIYTNSACGRLIQVDDFTQISRPPWGLTESKCENRY